MNQMHRVAQRRGGNGPQPTAQSRGRRRQGRKGREGFSRGDSAAAIRITCRSIDRFAAAPPGKFAEGRHVIDFLGGTPSCRLPPSPSSSNRNPFLRQFRRRRRRTIEIGRSPVMMSDDGRLPISGLPPGQPAEEARRREPGVVAGERVLAAEADDGLDEHRAVDGQPEEEVAAAPGTPCCRSKDLL